MSEFSFVGDKELYSIYLKVFDRISDAVFIYSESSLYHFNKPARKWFSTDLNQMKANFPLAYNNCLNKRFDFPLHDFECQWKLLQNSDLNDLGDCLFNLPSGNKLKAKTEIERISFEHLSFIVFVLKEISLADETEAAVKVKQLKACEYSLTESEKRYRTVAELSGSLIYELDLITNNITWQGPIEQITGYTQLEFEAIDLNGHFLNIHPDDRALVAEVFHGAVHERTPLKMDFRYKGKNGSFISIEEFGVVFYNERNEPIRIIGSKKDITERKRNEIKLEESEKWYRTLFEIANDAIFVVQDKYVVDCNSRAVSVFGRDKSQLVGKYGLTYSFEKQADGTSSYDKIIEILERFDTNKSCFFDWKFYRADGTVFDAEVSLSKIELSSKQIIIVIVRDVSDRKAVEQELIKKERGFRNLFNTMFNGLVLFSPIFNENGALIDAYYEDANPFFLKYKGKNRDEVIGRKISELGGGSVRWREKYEQVFKSGEPLIFQDYHPFYNKHYRVMVFKPSEEYFAVMLDDNTQQVLAENVLHENELKYQMLFNNMQSACTINLPYFDDQGKLIDVEYIEVNKAFEIQTGVSAEKVRGKRVSQLLNQYDTSWFELFSKAITTGQSISAEKYSHELKRHFRVNIFKQSEHYFATIFEDITEIKNAEQQILDTIVEVEERERQQLACDLHDEIGPQLVSMRLYLASLMRMGLSNSQKEVQQTIVELLDQTISSVRGISANLSPALLDRFGLAAAINAECDYARVQFQVDFKNNIQNIRFDRKFELMLYRIVKELLNNTKKYAEASKATLSVEYGNTSLLLIYTDNGKGFNYESVMNTPHTGIGLTNIEMRVKSLNGISGFKPNPIGNGVYFELTVPVISVSCLTNEVG